MIVAATRVVSEKASNGALNARVGLAISKKVDKRAVVRNRIKRQVRESFRQHLQELPPADFVVMANAAAADASGARIRDSLNAHWQRLARRLDGSQGHEKR